MHWVHLLRVSCRFDSYWGCHRARLGAISRSGFFFIFIFCFPRFYPGFLLLFAQPGKARSRFALRVLFYFYLLFPSVLSRIPSFVCAVGQGPEPFCAPGSFLFLPSVSLGSIPDSFFCLRSRARPGAVLRSRFFYFHLLLPAVLSRISPFVCAVGQGPEPFRVPGSFLFLPPISRGWRHRKERHSLKAMALFVLYRLLQYSILPSYSSRSPAKKRLRISEQDSSNTPAVTVGRWL